MTHFSVTARYPGYTLLDCRLETGRTHQIRVHMRHINHPLAGDGLYGGKPGELGLTGQCLYARQLAFDHPVSLEHMCFTAKRPVWFESALKKITPLCADVLSE